LEKEDDTAKKICINTLIQRSELPSTKNNNKTPHVNSQERPNSSPRAHTKGKKKQKDIVILVNVVVATH